MFSKNLPVDIAQTSGRECYPSYVSCFTAAMGAYPTFVGRDLECWRGRLHLSNWFPEDPISKYPIYQSSPAFFATFSQHSHRQNTLGLSKNLEQSVSPQSWTYRSTCLDGACMVDMGRPQQLTYFNDDLFDFGRFPRKLTEKDTQSPHTEKPRCYELRALEIFVNDFKKRRFRLGYTQAHVGKSACSYRYKCNIRYHSKLALLVKTAKV